MPKMGESIIEATVLTWLKEVGDKIELDEPIMEIATDKVDSEVPSPVDGVLQEKRFEVGAVVPVGEVIAIVETSAAEKPVVPDSPAGNSNQSNGHSHPEKINAPSLELVNTAVVTSTLSAPQSGRFYSPLVLNIARQEGISMAELELLPGTGREGRVTKKDILAYLSGPRVNSAALGVVEQKGNSQETEVKTLSVVKNTSPTNSGGLVQEKKFSHSGNFEIQEMDRMRKMIAENMVYSKSISAHVTSFVESDVTNLVQWRERNKVAFEKKYGEKLTFTPLFIEALVKALREHPMVNISVDGDNILVKKDINIGIAVALPSDNLIVPVIKNADQLNLVGLTAKVNDLAARARVNKLKIEELEGGTYTLSNVGTFGNVMGTPVIMQPQVAIMAVGAIRKKPAVIETAGGDFIGIRQMMFLSHSYDHRVVDGALGGRFVKRVADILENFDPHREI